jgi:hypothetical protein
MALLQSMVITEMHLIMSLTLMVVQLRIQPRDGHQSQFQEMLVDIGTLTLTMTLNNQELFIEKY